MQELALPADPTDFEQIDRLNDLRHAIAEIREEARDRAESGTLATRILDAQANALGPLPVDGASEPASVSARREAIDRVLSERLEPVLAAREAQARAATLVGEIDARLTRLTRARLFERNGTPLNPIAWGIAGTEVWRFVTSGYRDVAKALSGPNGTRNAGVMIGLLLFLAMLPWFLWKVTGWQQAKFALRHDRASTNIGRLGLLLLSDVLAAILLGLALILALVALVALSAPLNEADAVAPFAGSLLGAALTAAIGSWLAHSAFMSPIPELRVVSLDERYARKAMRLTRWLAFVLAIELFVDALERSATFVPVVANLLSALFLLVGGRMAWVLAELIEKHSARPPEPTGVVGNDEVDHKPVEFARPIARATRAILLLAALAALIGYVYLAREMFASTMETLGLIAIGAYLQRILRLVLVDAAQGRLRQYRGIIHFLPMVSGMILVLVGIPLLAMVWGYNSNEIFDAVALLRNGVELGEVKLTLGDVFTFAIVFFAGWFVVHWVQRILRVSVLPQFGVESSAAAAIATIFGYIGIVIAAVVAIATTGLDLSSLAFIAGALSVGLGFGLQSVIENFTSGLILLIERPVREGDWIEVGEYSGLVRKISVRSTRVETFDRHQIIIPNSQLITGTVKNLSLGENSARLIVDVGVAYGTDLAKAREVLIAAAAAHELVLTDPAPFVSFEEFGASSIDLKLFCFVQDVTKGGGTRSDIRFAIERAFADAGIEIPFPQRDINIRAVPASLERANIGNGDPSASPRADPA